MRGIEKLKAGDFNEITYEDAPDGAQMITLHKRGESLVYRFLVKDLYGPAEEVLSEEITGEAE